MSFNILNALPAQDAQTGNGERKDRERTREGVTPNVPRSNKGTAHTILKITNDANRALASKPGIQPILTTTDICRLPKVIITERLALDGLCV